MISFPVVDSRPRASQAEDFAVFRGSRARQHRFTESLALCARGARC
jgi:hypothetical protein